MARKKSPEPKDEEEKQEEIPTPTVKVTDEEKEDFFKAFLADKQFTVTETLFAGAVKVKFRSLTTQENMDIFDQLRKEQVEGTLTNDANYLTQLTAFRLALSLDELNDAPFAPGITKEDKNYVAAKAAIVKDWGVFKLSAIADAFKSFEDKLLFLTKEVQTENFWPAAR